MTTSEAVRNLAYRLSVAGTTEARELIAHAEAIAVLEAKVALYEKLGRRIVDGMNRMADDMVALENEVEARPVLPVDNSYSPVGLAIAGPAGVVSAYVPLVGNDQPRQSASSRQAGTAAVSPPSSP